MKNKLVVHTHHIASHFTNALWPVGALFLTFFFIGGGASFEQAAFYCFIISTLAAPFGLASGFVDWRTRFQGRSTRIFNHKLIFGSLFVLTSVLLVAWRASDGAVAAPGGQYRLIYVAATYVNSAFVLYLGYLGGKFI